MSNSPTKQQQQIQVKGQLFVGPLPHPDILVRYNDATPDGANRIIKMSESEQKHRHFIEKFALIGNFFAEYAALALATGLFGTVAYWGFSLVREGKEASGITAIIGAVLGPLVTWLVQRAKVPR